MIVSGGWYGVSKVVIGTLDIETCDFTERASSDLSGHTFGEGIAQVGEDTLYQLTYED